MDVLRLPGILAIALTACATTPPLTAEERERQACAAGDAYACEEIGIRYGNAGDLARARPVLVDACRRGSCGGFDSFFGKDRDAADMAREVCGDDAQCLDARRALFEEWKLREERSVAWKLFVEEATPLCSRAYVAAADARLPDCDINVFYANYDRFRRACERWDAQTASAYQAMFREAETLPHFRGELPPSAPPNGSHSSFAAQLATLQKCQPPSSRLDLSPEPPAQDTAAYVKALREGCRQSTATRERECLRLALYDRTKLDPRAPMTPAQEKELNAKYTELYGARDEARREAAATQAAFDAAEAERRAKPLLECRARAKAKGDAWQARITKLSRLARRRLNGTHVDPKDPESPIVRASGGLEYVKRSGDQLMIYNYGTQSTQIVDGGGYYRRYGSFSPTGVEVQQYYESRCARELQTP